jgi:hypothetical protein
MVALTVCRAVRIVRTYGQGRTRRNWGVLVVGVLHQLDVLLQDPPAFEPFVRWRSSGCRSRQGRKLFTVSAAQPAIGLERTGDDSLLVELLPGLGGGRVPQPAAAGGVAGEVVDGRLEGGGIPGPDE